MAEVTRVPLQPVRKGSLVKLWLMVALLVVAAALLAWVAVPKGVNVIEKTPGVGANPTGTDVALVNYVGKLGDGTVFDQGDGVPLPLEGMIPGFTEGLLQMQKGGSYTLEIPAEKGYGAEERSNPMTGEVIIPANSDLVFEIELLEFMSNADFERQMQMQQQIMQMQQQQQAEQEGAAPPQ